MIECCNVLHFMFAFVNEKVKTKHCVNVVMNSTIHYIKRFIKTTYNFEIIINAFCFVFCVGFFWGGGGPRKCEVVVLFLGFKGGLLIIRFPLITRTKKSCALRKTLNRYR